jgi:hypothetical protein
MQDISLNPFGLTLMSDYQVIWMKYTFDEENVLFVKNYQHLVPQPFRAKLIPVLSFV